MQITNQEYNFLMQLSHDTKADCWFNITQDDNGRDVVEDLETNEILDLAEGVDCLFDTVTDEIIRNFSPTELELFQSLERKILHEYTHCL